MDDFRPVVPPEAVHKAGMAAQRRRAQAVRVPAPVGTRHNVDVFGQAQKTREMRRLMALGWTRADAENEAFK